MKFLRLDKRINDSDFFGGVPVYLSRISRSSSRGILLDNQLNVAMMYMSKFDIYKLPGGGIEDGETKEDTFLREIKEETGCEAEIIEELGYIEEHKSRTEFMQYSYCFVAKALNTKTEALLTTYERELGLELHWMTMEKALAFMKDSFSKCNEYGMKFMILRDKTILEEASNKLGLNGGISSRLIGTENKK